MAKVFVFGNSLIEKDSLALRVAERLKGKVKGIEFEAVESLDEVEKSDNLYIMDVALGIEKVRLIKDLNKLNTGHPIGGHDFDLAMELKLLQKLGKIGNVRIIAIPANCNLEKAVKEVKRLLESLE